MRLDSGVVRDFREKVRYEDVYSDLHDVYKITNLRWDDEGTAVHFPGQFYMDYVNRLANYKAYIEPDMDARLLMELRKNALILTGYTDFYDRHAKCQTVGNVRKLRLDFIRGFCDEYEDAPWQYYLLIRNIYGAKRTERFMFDFEVSYQDGDYMKQTLVEDYRRDFINAHLRGYPGFNPDAY